MKCSGAPELVFCSMGWCLRCWDGMKSLRSSCSVMNVFQDAVCTLNTLQTNASALEQVKRERGHPQLQLQAMRGFLQRAGLKVSNTATRHETYSWRYVQNPFITVGIVLYHDNYYHKWLITFYANKSNVIWPFLYQSWQITIPP